MWAAVVGKELVWRKEIPTMFMLSVMKDIVSLLATCSGKKPCCFTVPYEKWNKSVGESWEEDISVEHWHACVSKCLEYFRSFKFEWSLNLRVLKFQLWVGQQKYVADEIFLFYGTV